MNYPLFTPGAQRQGAQEGKSTKNGLGKRKKTRGTLGERNRVALLRRRSRKVQMRVKGTKTRRKREETEWKGGQAVVEEKRQ